MVDTDIRRSLTPLWWGDESKQSDIQHKHVYVCLKNGKLMLLQKIFILNILNEHSILQTQEKGVNDIFLL